MAKKDFLAEMAAKVAFADAIIEAVKTHGMVKRRGGAKRKYKPRKKKGEIAAAPAPAPARRSHKKRKSKKSPLAATPAAQPE